VRHARRRGAGAFAEACIHHLVLDAGVHERSDAERFLVVPPLRAREHVEALWQGVRAGTIDTVGSDHAQSRFRPRGRTPSDFTSLPYGLAGVGERLPLLLSLGCARTIPLERLVQLVSTGPAKAFGLYPRKGTIVPGADADLVVWDPKADWEMPSAIHDGAESAYAGLRVRGRIRFVLRRGELLVAEGEFVAPPRGGRYLAAGHGALASPRR
jgi:dihydropyrimidinase